MAQGDQTVTVWLKENRNDTIGLPAIQEFTHVEDLRIIDGVYMVRTEDGTSATFPIHNVLASLAEGTE